MDIASTNAERVPLPVVHKDEGVSVKVDDTLKEMHDGQLAGGSVDEMSNGELLEPDWTPDEERRVTRKLDMILMPLLFFGFFALQLDRSNLSNALTSTIVEDLGVTRKTISGGNQLQLAGIVIAEIPANLILMKLGPARWLTLEAVLWGLVGVFQAFISGKGSFFATRFLLGLFEAGYIPGAQLLLSLFYKREEIATRTAIFYFGNYFSAGTGSLIAAGILRMAGKHGLAGWRWLFLIDGSASIFMAILFFLFLPSSPLHTMPVCKIQKLHYWTDRQRHIMHNRVMLDDPDKKSKFSEVTVKQVLHVLIDYRIWGHFAINLLALAPKGGLQLYSPYIIKKLGFSTSRANALASVSNYGVCILSFVVSWLSDKQGKRGQWCIIACCWSIAFAAAQFGVATSTNIWLKYAMFTLLSSGNGICQSLNDAWLNSNARSHQHRSIGLALVVIGSNLGGLAGQQLFQDSDAPRYIRAFTAILSLYAAAVVVVLIQMLFYARFNRKLAKQTSSEEDMTAAQQRQHRKAQL